MSFLRARATSPDRFSRGRAIPERDLAAAKARLRAEALRLRRTAYTHAAGAPEALCRNLLDGLPLRTACIVSGFWPMGEEIDVRPLLIALRARGHPLCLPTTGPRGSLLRFRRWAPGTELVSGVFGTREPPADAEGLDPDLVLVPLLAFDAAGWRVGYGGGYYDRTLRDLRARRPVMAVGIAFAAQQVAAVPHGDLDERLDWVVTEAGVLETGQEA